jgi:plastocyanin
MKRLSLGLILAFALAGCGGSSASPPAPAPTATAAPAATLVPNQQIEVALRDFKIDPSQITAQAPFEVAVTSSGPTPHNFTIRDGEGNVVVASEDLSAGDSDTVEVAELAAGEYTFFCSFAGHESLGMSGTLTVTE